MNRQGVWCADPYADAVSLNRQNADDYLRSDGYLLANPATENKHFGSPKLKTRRTKQNQTVGAGSRASVQQLPPNHDGQDEAGSRQSPKQAKYKSLPPCIPGRLVRLQTPPVRLAQLVGPRFVHDRVHLQ